MQTVALDEIRNASHRLRGVAVRTPLIPWFGDHSRSQQEPRLWLKAESLQPIGSFKLRGAYNKIASLPEEERRRGVITYSSGNHGQGVAYAARALGIRSIVVMPASAPALKIKATQNLGAEVVLVGPTSSERKRCAEALAATNGYIIIPPYDDEQIIAGQGTIGLEILEDLPTVDCVLVPVGGGGLISGVAAALKLTRPEVRVIGVEPELAADAKASFHSGRIIELTAEEAPRTIADGLRTQSLGKSNFEHIRRYVHGILTVSEQEIYGAMRLLALDARLTAEPSGAVAFAAYLYRTMELPNAGNRVAIISGGNVDPSLLAEVVAGNPPAVGGQ
ncbi:MAG TPA: threonine/serine dehydratase [Terriglobales bacterium]|nr:threonine/serine dehydratase [Terriglobales bacterium]